MIGRTLSWNDMERLRRDFDQLFEGSFPALQRTRGRSYPAINIWTNDAEGAIVTAELPGIEANDLSISATGDTLTLSGKCNPPEDTVQEQYHRQERTYRSFERVIQLPYSVDSSGIEASLKKGVLRIFLPRAEAEKPRQITVKASE